MKSKKYSYTLPSRKLEVTQEKQEAINNGVMIFCIITGGLVGLYLAYDISVKDLLLNFSFWDAIWLILLHSAGLLFAGVTCGGFGSFLVNKVVYGILFLFWPAYRRTCQRQKGFITHESVWALLAVNLYIMGAALYENWDLPFLLWVYWLQSLLLGIFWSLFLGYVVGSGSTEERRLQKVWGYFLGTACYMMLYGTPLLSLSGYLMELEPHPPWEVFLYGGLFLFEPVWFFFRNRDEFKGNDHIFNRLFYWPFLRLTPLIIIPFVASKNSLFTVTGTNALALFMVGKIIIDQIMHVQQLKAFERRSGDD